MRRAIVASLSLMGAVCLTACQKASEPAEPAPTAIVGIQPAARHSVSDTLAAYGTLEVVPSHTRSLTIQVESQVAERFVLTGAAVKTGDPLLRLVPSASSHLDVDKASRDADVAEAEAGRVRRLHEQGLATDSDLRVAQAAAQSAVALRNSLNSRIGPEGLTLRAPIAGIVDGLTAQPGEVLAPGAQVLRISDPNTLYARVGVEAQDALRVKAGQNATLSALFPGATPFAGTVGEVDARVDPQSHLAMAVVRTDSASPSFLPGSAVRAQIVVSTHDSVITVPRAAVLYADEKPFVFVAKAGGDVKKGTDARGGELKAERRSVVVGLEDDTQVEVTQGLAVGERVIVSGNYELDDGMVVKDESAKDDDAKDEPAKDAPAKDAHAS
jgi:RND family efflux transporter MFP subunit